MKVVVHSGEKARSPKAEGRKKPEARRPNCAASSHAPLSPSSDFGFRSSAFLRPSTFDPRPSAQRAVALVITLIMLSVITFMAIAFLVLSRGERSSTATATDQSLARLGADYALQRAEIELLAPMMVSGNASSSGLLVSTNLVNPNGFQGGTAILPIYTSPTNVAYNYPNGGPLNAKDSLQNLTNLLINPRPPVFIVTNRQTGASDFRYYLDLNRNGLFEQTGWIRVTNYSGLPAPDGKGGVLVDYVQGDPQWVGALEFPDRHHSPDNRFLYRYAYMAVPISEALDINYSHNAANRPGKGQIDPTGADFLRNQGVGTWEINLAAFLFDLNTNLYAWGGPFTYRPQVGPTFPPAVIRGNAFLDACSILGNRYGGLNNYPTRLSSVRNLYFNGTLAFANHSFDGYTAGPLMIGPSSYTINPDANPRSTFPWPGADNTNHFFSTQDLFDPAKTSANFATRLMSAGTNIDTYDRYTFSRLVSQLGTDSAPEPPGKINLNYDNRVQTNVQGVVSATNFFPWKPINFFSNTANALLANAGFTNMTITNLIVYPFNFYTPSVHRLLQLAANIYDASGATNRALAGSAAVPAFPSVFRPIFRKVITPTNTLVMIVGYREVLNATQLTDPRTAPLMVELDNPASPVGGTGQILTSQVIWTDTREKNEPLVSGIPLIIGAKRGFPNFNELEMQTQLNVSRLLEFRRAPGDSKGPIVATNQMYVLTITNTYGLEAWNSYLTNYPSDLRLVTSMLMTAIITNELGGPNIVFSNRVAGLTNMLIAANTWKGWLDKNQAPYSMVLPFGNASGYPWTNATMLDHFPWLEPLTHIFPPVQRGPFYTPHWWLNLNTRLQFFLIDTRADRLVDYVNINNWETTLDITAKLTENLNFSNLGDYKTRANLWVTNRLGGSLSPNVPTYGIMNQIAVGVNGVDGIVDWWRSFSQDPYSGLDANKAVDGFRWNLAELPPINKDDAGLTFYKSNVFYAPFDPYRPIYVHTSWQANDPLVHYTVGDLIDVTIPETNRVDFQSRVPALENIGQINKRYRPWGGNPGSLDPMTDNQVAVKDPYVNRSDDWDFPTNKFPNIGWLGRVHRGTPWQTVFLKSTNFLTSAGLFPQSLLQWQIWTGNPYRDFNLVTNAFPEHIQTNLVGPNLFVDDAIFTAPTNDWHILDLFTTAVNDNAGRGQLSVNQTNLAAWSAVLSGVSVLANVADTNNPTFILPAGADPILPPRAPGILRILSGINNTRTNSLLFPKHAFTRLGDILATPELSIASPYLTTNSVAVTNDAVVERIPQQILGLLHGPEQPPRFVIYSYGQALKPAAKSLYTGGGPFFGLCTNYQITAEVATRTVVRIEGAPNKPRTVIESFNVLPPD